MRNAFSARHGQSTVDFAIAFGMAAAALATMSIYAARAIHGGFRASVDQLGGEQFDPREPFHENQSLNAMHEFTKSVAVYSSPSAPFLGGTSQSSIIGPHSDEDQLPSIPGGLVPREVAATQTLTESTWSTNHDAEYHASQ